MCCECIVNMIEWNIKLIRFRRKNILVFSKCNYSIQFSLSIIWILIRVFFIYPLENKMSPEEYEGKVLISRNRYRASPFTSRKHEQIQTGKCNFYFRFWIRWQQTTPERLHRSPVRQSIKPNLPVLSRKTVAFSILPIMSLLYSSTEKYECAKIRSIKLTKLLEAIILI